MLHCKNDDKYYTVTREGKVPHLNARIGGYDLCMPVKLKGADTTPVTDKYGYVYALPDGRSINLNGDIF